MRLNSIFLSSIIILIVLLGCGNENSNEVKIGNQVWMKENLNVSRFRNGDPIPEAKTKDEWIQAGIERQAVWCYYDNDFKNGTKYGKLYNWYAVNDPRGLAPEGWDIPTDDDWEILYAFLGDRADFKLKSKDYWSIKNDLTNLSGFDAVPSGMRNPDGLFSFKGDSGFIWTSNCSYETFYSQIPPPVILGGDHILCGVSVRCIKE
jgi:uncharacterized protein (TIGR02145 family)